MLPFMEDKKVVVKRYSSSLGEFNRPNKTLEEVGIYFCHVAESSSNTVQKQPQKESTTELTLYCDPEAEIHKGDILFIYEIDEDEEIILATEVKAIANKPYKKRTHLEIPLNSVEEV